MKIQKTKNFMKKLLGLFFFILFLFSISTKVKASGPSGEAKFEGSR